MITTSARDAEQMTVQELTQLSLRSNDELAGFFSRVWRGVRRLARPVTQAVRGLGRSVRVLAPMAVPLIVAGSPGSRIGGWLRGSTGRTAMVGMRMVGSAAAQRQAVDTRAQYAAQNRTAAARRQQRIAAFTQQLRALSIDALHAKYGYTKAREIMVQRQSTGFEQWVRTNFRFQ